MVQNPEKQSGKENRMPSAEKPEGKGKAVQNSGKQSGKENTAPGSEKQNGKGKAQQKTEKQSGRESTVPNAEKQSGKGKAAQGSEKQTKKDTVEKNSFKQNKDRGYSENESGEAADRKYLGRKYIYNMFSIFGALALSLLLAFLLFQRELIGEKVSELIQILQPFIFGGIIAYLLRPTCNFIETKLTKILPERFRKAAGPASVTLSLLFGFLVIGVLLWMVIPQLYSTVVSLYNTLPDQIDEWVKKAENYLENNPTLQNNIVSVYDTVKDSVTNWVETKIIPQLDNVASGVGTGAKNSIVTLKNLLIGVIVSVYFLGSRKVFAKQSRLVVYGIFKKDWADTILTEVKFADDMFSGFIDGKLVDSLIIGLLCFIFCTITQMPSALLLSVIIGVTNIIPFFGPIIGAVPATIIILVSSPIKAVWFVIFVIVLQTLDGNVIGPLILGDKTGLSSFWVLFAILLFGGLFGVPGMIIGVPLFAVIYDIIKKLILRGLKKHGYDMSTVDFGTGQTEKDSGGQSGKENRSFRKKKNHRTNQNAAGIASAEKNSKQSPEEEKRSSVEDIVSRIEKEEQSKFEQELAEEIDLTPVNKDI